MVLLLLLLQFATPITLTIEDKFAWRQANMTEDESKRFIFKYYIGPSITGVPLTGVVCTRSNPAEAFLNCKADVPKLMNGVYTFQMTSTNPETNIESVKSNPFTFVLASKPPPPADFGPDRSQQ